jgi:hypothetical protein
MAETNKTKSHEIGGVQVYARRDHEGKPSKADAIDEAMQGLAHFVKEQRISAARFTAIGALSRDARLF